MLSTSTSPTLTSSWWIVRSRCAGRPYLGPGARRTVAVLLAMIVLLATGVGPAAVAGMLAAGA